MELCDQFFQIWSYLALYWHYFFSLFFFLNLLKVMEKLWKSMLEHKKIKFFIFIIKLISWVGAQALCARSGCIFFCIIALILIVVGVECSNKTIEFLVSWDPKFSRSKAIFIHTKWLKFAKIFYWVPESFLACFLPKFL